MMPMIVFVLLVTAGMAFAQVTTETPTGDLTFGQYPLYVVLTMITMALYRFINVNDRLKGLISVCLGLGLGVLWLYYSGTECTPPTVINALLYGLSQGLAAVGLYEVQDKVRSAAIKGR